MDNETLNPVNDLWMVANVSYNKDENEKIVDSTTKVKYSGTYDQVKKRVKTKDGTTSGQLCKVARSERVVRNMTPKEVIIYYGKYEPSVDHAKNLRKRHVEEDPVNKYARI